MMTIADIGPGFVDVTVPGWSWIALLALIGALLAGDILVVHRRVHDVSAREAVVSSALWIAIGLAFSGVIAASFGAAASGEYISGYLLEMSLSVDNIFVWAVILTSFKIPEKYQHRILFSGVIVALVLRAGFIFAGVALVERFAWVLYIFGAFLLYTAGTLIFTDEDDDERTEVIGDSVSGNPLFTRLMKIVSRVIPISESIDDKKFITRYQGRIVATPLLAVLLVIEFTDVLFAVDSVPAVLAISREEFLVFSSNAFAILGLRALYFLVADARNRFSYLEYGVAVILAFVGVKMVFHQWFQIPTWSSLLFIGLVLVVAIGFSLRAKNSRDVVVPLSLPESESLDETKSLDETEPLDETAPKGSKSDIGEPNRAEQPPVQER